MRGDSADIDGGLHVADATTPRESPIVLCSAATTESRIIDSPLNDVVYSLSKENADLNLLSGPKEIVGGASSTTTTTTTNEPPDDEVPKVVQHVDVKTKAMGVKAELEELRRRSLTQKEVSRVLNRLSLSAQVDPVPTHELSDFFLRQKDKDREWKQKHRESMEYLHQYRGSEITPTASNDNNYPEANFLRSPAYSSMSELDLFTQQQRETERDWKQQKRMSLENIRNYRNNFVEPSNCVQMARPVRADVSIESSNTISNGRENTASPALSQLTVATSVLESSSTDDDDAEEAEDKNGILGIFQSLRQSTPRDDNFGSRTPLRPPTSYRGESSDSSVVSSATKKLDVLGSFDVHVFEDGEESVDDVSGGRPTPKSTFVLGDLKKHRFEMPKDVSIPELPYLLESLTTVSLLDPAIVPRNLTDEKDKLDPATGNPPVEFHELDHAPIPPRREESSHLTLLELDPIKVVKDEQQVSDISRMTEPKRRRSRMSYIVPPTIRSPREAVERKEPRKAASDRTMEKPQKAGVDIINNSNNIKAFPSLKSLRKIFSRNSTRDKPPPSTPTTPPLKQVPLYSRRPLTEDKKEVLAVCHHRFIPDLHKTRAGCERCLYWASQSEKDMFEARGHHFRIMMVRGGCDRSCAVFPREPDEYPVRLCRKCFFDTHQFGQYYVV